MKRRSLALLVVSAVMSLTAIAQSPVMPLIGETVEVSIVNVDVYVTDKSGKRILGVRPEDFTIYENGKPQEITNFSEFRGDALPARLTSTTLLPGKAVLDKPPKRTMVLFVDAFVLPDRQIEPIFSAMKRLLRNVVRKGDAVTILTWRASRLETRQIYTDDVRALERKLDEIRYEQTLGARKAGESLARNAVPITTRQTANRRLQRELEEAAYWSRTMSDKAVKAPGREGAATALRAVAQEAYFDMKQKTNALNATIASLAGLEGKKSLLFASHRFSIYPGAEYFYLTGSDEVPVGERSNIEGKPLIDSLVANANASGVTIYPFYPEGLTSQTSPDAEEVRTELGGSASTDPNQDYKILSNEVAALSNIAVRTGGLMAFGADVAKTLTRVQEDLDSYYSLAYRTPPGSGDSARQILVKSKNPEWIVRSRREYVERPESARMKDRILASLFHGDDAKNTVAFQVALATPTKKKRGVFLVPVTVRIPIASLATLPQEGRRAGEFSVYLATAAEIGRVGEVTRQTQSFFIKDADSEGARGKFIAYEVKLMVDSSATRVAVGVFDEVSREHGIQQIALPRLR